MYKNMKTIFMAEIIKTVNSKILDDGFVLVRPDQCYGGAYDDWLLWLVNTAGKIVLKSVDLSQYSEGINLLDFEGPYGFDFIIANICDGLLIDAGGELVPPEI